MIKCILILILLFHSSFSWTCRALALGSAGDRFPYEAGVLESLLRFEKPENIKYDVIGGVSGGAINSAIFAEFEKGREAEAIQKIKTLSLSLKNTDIFKNWFPGGMVQGFFFKTGLYDSSPLFDMIKKNIRIEEIKKAKRVYITGAHSVTKSNFRVFNNSNSNLQLGIYASASLIGIFPTVKIGEEHFIDGSVSYTTPLTSVIRACKKLGATNVHVDSILSVGDSSIPDLIKGRTTPFVLLRTLFHIVTGWFHRDIVHARTAFPNSKIREFKPTKPLPGTYFGFDKAKELFDIGLKDGKEIIQETLRSS